MLKPLAEVRELTYRYPDSASTALEDVDFELGEGEFVVLAGGSGSGKSTLLRALAGLVPHFFGGEISGHVEVDGIGTRDNDPARIADSVGSLFQDPESQVVMSSADAELSLSLEQRGLSREIIARSVEETVLALGIPHLRGRVVAELSGGELQRLALAAVLAPCPALALLDEPTSQLDPVAADELFSLLHRLNSEHGMTVLLAEHRLERCLPYADRVIAMDRGRLVCDAKTEEFLSWALDRKPELATPLAHMFSLSDIHPPPVDVKSARMRLREFGLSVLAGGTGAGSSQVATPRRKGIGSRALEKLFRKRAGGPAPLEVRNLRHRYSSGVEEVEALCDVGFTVEAGERVVLMGRNGAGKSTLLKHFSGLLRPAGGRVEVCGRSIAGLDRSEVQELVALLLQNPGDYLLAERVADELPRELSGRVLEEIGLEEYADCHPHDLSAGQKQKLALAIVLAGRGWPEGDPPPLIALDEPTRGLDRKGKQELADMLKDFSARGSAVVVATHDVELAALFASRVLLMADGQIVADGDSCELLSGGWYFSTDVARALGRDSGIILPEQGAISIRDRAAEMQWASR